MGCVKGPPVRACSIEGLNSLFFWTPNFPGFLLLYHDHAKTAQFLDERVSVTRSSNPPGFLTLGQSPQGDILPQLVFMCTKRSQEKFASIPSFWDSKKVNEKQCELLLVASYSTAIDCKAIFRLNLSSCAHEGARKNSRALRPSKMAPEMHLAIHR